MEKVHGKSGVVKDCVEGNTIERKGCSCSCRLDSVTEAAIAGKSCGVRLVQVRLEEVRCETKRLGEYSEM